MSDSRCFLHLFNIRPILNKTINEFLNKTQPVLYNRFIFARLLIHFKKNFFAPSLIPTSSIFQIAQYFFCSIFIIDFLIRFF